MLCDGTQMKFRFRFQYLANLLFGLGHVSVIFEFWSPFENENSCMQGQISEDLKSLRQKMFQSWPRILYLKLKRIWL